MFVALFKPTLLVKYEGTRTRMVMFIIYASLFILSMMCIGISGTSLCQEVTKIGPSNHTPVSANVESPAKKPIDRNSKNYINEDFSWVERPIPDNGAIIGKLKNTSNKNFHMITINFVLCYEDGTQAGVVNQTIANSTAGNTWKFAIPVDKRDIAGFKFLSIETIE
jgi:hypothetical protein